MTGIQMSLMGSAGAIVQLAYRAVNDLESAPGPAIAGFQLNASGKAEQNTGSGFAGTEDWVLPNNAANQYECRATLVSGTLFSGTVNTWMALSSSRNWSTQQSSVGSMIAQLNIEIRPVGGSVLVTTTIDLNAEII